MTSKKDSDYGFRENEDGKLEPVPGKLKTEEEMFNPRQSAEDLQKLEEKKRMELRGINKQLELIHAQMRNLGTLQTQAANVLRELGKIRGGIQNLNRLYRTKKGLIDELTKIHTDLDRISHDLGDVILIDQTRKLISKFQNMIR